MRPSKLTPQQWQQLHDRLLAGESARSLGREFGVSETAIRKKFASGLKVRAANVRIVAEKLADAEDALHALPLSARPAALALGVQSQRSGFGPGAGYVWTAAKLRAAGEGAGEPKRGEGMRDTTALPPGTPAPGTPQPGAHAAAPAPPQASPVPQAQSGSAAAAAAEYAAARAMRADALVTWCGHSRAAAEAQAWLEYPLDADTVRRNAAAAAGDPQTH